MDTRPSPESLGPLTQRSPPAQWLVILAISALFVFLLELASLPAALLIGPMLAAIIAGTNGATVRIPGLLFSAAQAVVGCLIARSIQIEIVSAFLHEWLLFASVVIATVAASSFMGYLISRWRVLPGTTAVWGSAPGAATAMVLMADAFGADSRLVAFMQYLRVIFVSMAAALVARYWVDTSGVSVPQIVWFPPIDPLGLGATVAVALVGGIAGRLLRLPSPFFLGTAILGIALHLATGLDFQLPQWLLAVSYAMVGWTIGLNFNRAIVRHATKALPQVIASILILIGFCGSLAWLLHHMLGIDPLTAYLATSPGGMDSVAIIAAASGHVNLSFVMALQMARFMFVLLFGPAIARLVARAVKT